MLLTITTTHRPAPDLGFLLHKHPGRFQTFPLAFGQARVFYPEADEARCTAALLLDIDPVGLVRRERGAGAGIEPYVNDRPYVASSFMSVAIGEVFGSALAGQSKERPALADAAIPLEATLSAVRSHGDEGLLRRLFAPLGYTTVGATRHPLDEAFPAWGSGIYDTIRLAGTLRLRDLLRQLTVLIPVLDDEKHYWVGEDELEKLLRRGEGWLEGHPERELIAERYLKRRRTLVREAIARLAGEDATGDPDEAVAARDREEAAVERPMGLHAARLAAVAGAIREAGAASVLDLGCGEGRLMKLLLGERAIGRLTGVDVSVAALQAASRRLRLDEAPAKGRATLLHGALTYRDARWDGYDAAAVVEVIEHLDEPRLEAFARSLFGAARPGTVVVTTPNREYNARFPSLPAGAMRHRDHRFEWTRAEFRAWAEGIAGRFGYGTRFAGIGPEDATHGAPSQMAVFTRGPVALRETRG